MRAARQQDFLRQVKQQVGAFGLIINDRDKLLHIFAQATRAPTCDSRSGILRLLKLAVVLGQPPDPGDPLPRRKLGAELRRRTRRA